MKKITPLVIFLFMTLDICAAELKVEVQSVQSVKGKLYIRVWDNKQDWLKTGPKNIRAEKVLTTSTLSNSGWTSHTFDLPKGDYAVAVFHDLDGNTDLNTDSLGRPTEPIANTARSYNMMGPPEFENSVITLDTELKVVSLKLR